VNALIITLSVLAVALVAGVVGLLYLASRKPPPLTEAEELLLESALSEYLAPGQSITFGGPNAERLQAEYNRRRAEADELQADMEGLHQTLAEFLGSTNFQADAFDFGLFTRAPDPTDESVVSGSEYTSGGNTRHDALKKARAQFDAAFSEPRLHIVTPGGELFMTTKELEEAKSLVEMADGFSKSLDLHVFNMLRTVPVALVKVDELEPHERATILRVLDVAEYRPEPTAAELCNVMGWRLALTPQPTTACGLDSCSGCTVCGVDENTEIGRVEDVRLVVEPFRIEDSGLFRHAVLFQAGEGSTEAPESTEEPKAPKMIGLPVWEMGEEPEPSIGSIARIAKTAQEVLDAAKACGMSEEAAKNLLTDSARSALDVCPCSFCQESRQATHEALWEAVLEGIQSTPLAEKVRQAEEKAMGDATKTGTGAILAGFEIDGHGGLVGRISHIEPMRFQPGAVNYGPVEVSSIPKAGFHTAMKALTSLRDKGTPAGQFSRDYPVYVWSDVAAAINEAFGCSVESALLEALKSAPENVQYTREAGNGIASSYPVAENAGLTSDQIDFGIERRYPFVSRFGAHDGKFRHEPGNDEGSQP